MDASVVQRSFHYTAITVIKHSFYRQFKHIFATYSVAAPAIFCWARGQYDYQTALQTPQTAPDLALFLILVAHCWVLVANNICQNELFAYQ
jgi:hypothetical protein